MQNETQKTVRVAWLIEFRVSRSGSVNHWTQGTADSGNSQMNEVLIEQNNVGVARVVSLLLLLWVF